jgi:HEAT repeat protein
MLYSGMRSPVDVLWRLLPEVRSAERSRALFFTALLALVSGAQTLGLAGSEALLLARLGAGWLPQTFVAAALVTVLGSLAYALRVGRARNDELFGRMLLASAALLGIAAALAGAGTVWVLPALFCFFYLTQSVFMNHFWTFSCDYFDTFTSKRLFPVFTVGASLGGLLGGAAAMLVTYTAGPVALIAAWGGVLFAAALVLRLGRRALHSWGPLEPTEADETSMEGMRSAACYLRGSPFGHWLVISALGMVLALFIAQYLYSDIFARLYPEPDELAMFFGLFLAVSNLVEIALELVVTPWLIRRLGVSTAHLAHPVLVLASFAGLFVQYGFAAGAGARVSRELVENAVAQPIRTLMYNALPPRFRGRIRAFLEGVVVYAGMLLAGLLLLALGDPEPRWLCAAGAAASLLYFAANLRARGEYVHTLVSEIRAGRIDVAEIESEIGDWETAQLAELCRQMLRDAVGQASRPLLRMIPLLAERGVAQPLLEGARHAIPEVRRSCIGALAASRAEDAEAVFLHTLSDPDASVRLETLRALAPKEPSSTALARSVAVLADDPDPHVRAEAALRCGPRGIPLLRAMLASGSRRDVLAALSAAPPALVEDVAGRTRDPDSEIRAVALDRLVQIGSEIPLSLGELREALGNPHPSMRRAAVSALCRVAHDDAASTLASALADPSAEVRQRAIDGLVALGERGAEASVSHLRDDQEHSIEGALQVIGACGSGRCREILAHEFAYRVRQLWFRLLAAQRLSNHSDVVTRFLHVAYEDGMLRSRWVAFRILEQLERPTMIRKLERALQFGTPRARGDALEVLENLGDRRMARLLVLAHENDPLEERAAAAEAIERIPQDFSSLLAASRRSELRFIRMAAEALGDPLRQDLAERNTMERLLALKRVPLFANLTLEQLEAMHQLTVESSYLPGEIILREGDLGGEFYLLLEGAVDVYLNYGAADQECIRALGAADYFGEMAIFDDQPRSATIVARDHTRLLVLDGASLKELIVKMPEIAFDLMRVLATRLRFAEHRHGGHPDLT